MPKEKKNWVNKLKKNVQTILKGPGHSPAGKKHLAKQKKKKAALKGFSTRTRRELSYLSDADRKAVLKALGRK